MAPDCARARARTVCPWVSRYNDDVVMDVIVTEYVASEGKSYPDPAGTSMFS